jgi:hypothetical protein
MRKVVSTGKKTQAKRTRVTVRTVARHTAASLRQKSKAAIAQPGSVITLNAADSQKLADYLLAPAREPKEYMKAALADYRRLVQG